MRRLNSRRWGAGVHGWTRSPPFSGGGGCGAPWQRRPALCSQKSTAQQEGTQLGNSHTLITSQRRYRPARRVAASLQHCLGSGGPPPAACSRLAPLLPDSSPPESSPAWLSPFPQRTVPIVCAPLSFCTACPSFPGSSVGHLPPVSLFDPLSPLSPHRPVSRLFSGTASHIRATTDFISPCTLAAAWRLGTLRKCPFWVPPRA